MVLQIAKAVLLERILAMSGWCHVEKVDANVTPDPIGESIDTDSTGTEFQISEASDSSPVVCMSSGYAEGGTVLTTYPSVIAPADVPTQSYASRPLTFFQNQQGLYLPVVYHASFVQMPRMEFYDLPQMDELRASAVAADRKGCLKLRNRGKCEKHCQHSKFERDMWVFELRKDLCGRLIGKGGRSIQWIMQETGTYLALCTEQENPAIQLLKIFGTENQILHAVKVIESKFINENTEFESKTLVLMEREKTLLARHMQIPSDKEVQVTIGSIIHAGHLYLLLPHLKTSPSRIIFEKELARCYNSGHIPTLDRFPVPGTYCVGKIDEKWFRIQVISSYAKAKKIEAILVDYGTSMVLPSSSLRKIRADLLEVPFQAIECCLANIIPQSGDSFFSMSETNLFVKLIENKSLKAIARATRNGLQYVELFFQENNKLTSVNRRLVAFGAAQWVDM